MSSPPDPPSPVVDDVPPSTKLAPEVVLFRSSADRYLSGLAGGIGERTATDPLYYRIGLVAGTLYMSYATGLFAIVPALYVLGWITVPKRAEQSLIRRLGQREAQQEMAGAFALLVVSLVVLDNSGLVFPVVLAGLALTLLGDRHTPFRSPSSQRPPPPSSPPDGPEPLLPAPAFGSEPEGGPGSDDRAFRGWRTHRDNRTESTPQPLRIQREPALWPLTLALLLGLAVVGILVDRFGDPGLDPRIALDLALLIIGAVLLLSFWRGRAGVTVLWALPLLPFWFATSVSDIGRFAGEGSANYAPSQYVTGDPALQYELGYGNLEVNLLGLDLMPGQSVEVEIDLTMGKATVIVPSNTQVVLTGKMGLGSIEEVDYGPYGRFSSDTVMNWGLGRTYPAAGPYCEPAIVAGYALRTFLPGESQTVQFEASGEETRWLDAFESAGFARPTLEYTEQELLPVDETDGLDNPEEYVAVDHYQIDLDEFGRACLPEITPETPVVINVDATVGLGTLEIVHG